jgi:predicted TIM-barrel fold metal-dependent hydrolase
MPFIVNCHTHLFTFHHVPVHFITGQWLFASSDAGRNRLAHLLFSLNPWSDAGKIYRIATFLHGGNYASQEELFECLCMFYPPSARFAVHAIDFEYMGAGRTPKSYLEQLAELAALKRKYPKKIYPFICTDPRRPDLYDLFKRYIEEEDFTGIKLYPPMGYYPFDERLYPLYDYAQTHQIPVMTHCSSSGSVFSRNTPLPKERFHPKTQTPLKYKNKRQFSDHYTHPDNYTCLLDDFPLLKICFAHFGGDAQCKKYYKSNDPSDIENNWLVKVFRLIKKYRNVYADISYAAADFDLLALFNALLHDPSNKHKMLFGSDFYMSNLERNERWFSMNVRMHLGEESYLQIAHTNALKYLNITT